MEDNSCPGAIRRSAKAALLALALVASVSCGAQQGDDEATAPTPNPGESSTPSSVEGAHDAAAPAAAETYDVGQVERTYVDDTRPTVAHGVMSRHARKPPSCAPPPTASRLAVPTSSC